MRQLSLQQKTIRDFAAQGCASNFAIRARAGTGKSTMAETIVAVSPARSILNVQFNKRNQLEMAGRITDPRCTVATFHSACNKFLSRQWGFVQAKSFWAEANRVNVIDSTCKKVPLNQVTKLISALKNELPFIPTAAQAMQIALKYGIEDCEKHKFPLNKIVELATAAIPLCLEKPKSKQISFEDMIFVPLVNGWLKQAGELIIGDEFQDFNPVQHEAFLKLRGDGQACILGDDRQQIYTWRGAMDNGLDKMIERLGATVFPLTVTYRCPKSVVALSNPIVPDFEAHESAPNGEVNETGFNSLFNHKPGDAILSRLNAPLMGIALEFLRRNQACRIEGKDIGAALQGVIKQANTEGNSDIVTFLGDLETWYAARCQKAQGYNTETIIDMVTDQRDTIKVLAENCNSVPDMGNKIELLFEDSQGNERPAVKCSSIHKAKGLEWRNVSVLMDSFGKRKVVKEPGREESNLRYVAYTRSKHTLNLVKGLKKEAQA